MIPNYFKKHQFNFKKTNLDSATNEITILSTTKLLGIVENSTSLDDEGIRQKDLKTIIVYLDADIVIEMGDIIEFKEEDYNIIDLNRVTDIRDRFSHFVLECIV